MECMFDMVSMRLCASSMMTTWPLKEISRASLADFCNSRGYGNVIIYNWLAIHVYGRLVVLTSLGLIVALEA